MHSSPPRYHRPNKQAFATQVSQLIRREMNPKGGRVHDQALEDLGKLKDEDIGVRRNASEALWRMMDVPKAWGNESFDPNYMRENDAQASPEVYEGLIAAALDDDWKVRWDVGLALSKLGHQDRWNTDPYIARLASKLKKDSTSPEHKAKIADVLGKIGSPAHPYSRIIGSQLEHEDPRVRIACVEAMGRMGPESTLCRSVIVRLQRDDYEEIREAAERVLRRIPYVEPGWLEKQDPAFRWRILKSNRGKHRNRGKKASKL